MSEIPKYYVHLFLTSWESYITVSLMIRIGEARLAIVLKAYKALFSKICWWHLCKQSTHKCFFFIHRKLLFVDVLEIYYFLNSKTSTFRSVKFLTRFWYLGYPERLIQKQWAVSFFMACLQTLQTLSLQAKRLCIALRDAYFLFNSLT